MRYEHLIQINDPTNPLIAPLTRAQLWAGLVRRAEFPVEFALGLESAEVGERQPHGADGGWRLSRTLDFGPFAVRDVVVAEPENRLRIEALASAAFGRSQLTMTIEAPAEDALFLRCVYETEAAAGQPEPESMLVELREQAYLAADLDMVKRIRELLSNDGGMSPLG
ncbi:AtaL-like protein [Derxia lacustris]|uniref:AtaL-like protein n=1 Tax=Derxia lacustris TaxID=764842 RepID=UPI000A170868|nr:AtaL-like protein [Derxia lacustris]